MKGFAHLRTRVAAGSTASQIASGGTVFVYGINVYNNSGGAAAVTVLDGAGTTTIDQIAAADGQSISMEVPWLAGGGISITTPTGVVATVYHSQPGA